MKTIAEVSKETGISVYTIHSWIRSGRIKATKIGRKWRISEEEIQKVKSGLI